MITHLLPKIYKHLEKESPREACGLITLNDTEAEWVPIKNISENADNFQMDTKEYIQAALENKIIGVLHSHIDSSAEPSDFDRKQCNGLNLDYYIISLPSKELYHLKPRTT